MTSAPDGDVTDWLRRLVAHQTVAGGSNTGLIGDVRAYFGQLGVHCEVIPGTREGTQNLLAVLGPRDRAGALLSAHTDVVSAETSGWASDPFVLTRRASRLYGRGTTDMKGFIAAVLACVPAVLRRGLQRPLVIALSADEELGVQGVAPMLDVLAEAPYKPAFCVIGEPTGMRVVVAHKGKLTLRVVVTGRAAHSSAAPSGVSAIAYAAEMIGGLYAYQAQLDQEDGDQRFAVPHASVNVGTIDGGTAVNIVASKCVFDVEIRCLPR